MAAPTRGGGERSALQVRPISKPQPATERHGSATDPGGRPVHHSRTTYSAGVLAIDPVIVLVEDLDAAARRYDEHKGLGSVPGGRHPGHGTANRIVPLGGSYLELMAVVDRVEADSSPLGRWVRRRLGEVGESPGALCLRTDDIEGAARLTGGRPLPSTGSSSAATRIDSHDGSESMTFLFGTSKAHQGRIGWPRPSRTASRS